jgi:hypothetical protein
MAEIAVEPRSRTPWWVWLLTALLIVALVWWISTRNDTTAYVEPAGTATTAAETAPMTGALASLTEIYNVTDPTPYVGRTVAIDEPVRVLSVTGDSTFWVGEGTGRQALIVLDEQPTPGQPQTEGRYDVNPGQTVRIWGDIQRFPGFDEARRMWNVNPNVRSELENQQLYVHANRLEIVSRP